MLLFSIQRHAWIEASWTHGYKVGERVKGHTKISSKTKGRTNIVRPFVLELKLMLIESQNLHQEVALFFEQHL
ncbi:hypothetical protein GCM10023188_09420 [Pontibacter saemangeumensis]|uniref:Uncharacterized protein n=1 Tax=Pontibacter saemangeumensis TaxID=1084525 RepID=A0ABP8LEH6_9BACT